MYGETKECSQEKRLIVCINSLRKVELEEWDLVIIDEAQQVLLALCKLVKKGEIGSPVDVYKKLKIIVERAGRIISMAADGGPLCKIFYDAFGYVSLPIDEHKESTANGKIISWVANQHKSLKDNTYKFIISLV